MGEYLIHKWNDMHWGVVVELNLVGLAGRARPDPLSNIMSHAMPHKPVTHQMLGSVHPGVGQAMQEVKDLAMRIWWHDQSGKPVKRSQSKVVW